MNDDPRRAFAQKEFEALRKQVDQMLGEMLTTERWLVVTCAAIWSWLSLNQGARPPTLFYWAPAILCLLCGLRVLGIHFTVLRIGRYIRQLEMLLYSSHKRGWEHSAARRNLLALSIGGYLFWVSILGINIFIPAYYIPRQLDQQPNKAPEPTPTAVTPPAAQESRRP